MSKSITAGIMIGIGAMVYSLCPDKIVGSVMFSLGLYSVLTFESSLYTGKVGYLIMHPVDNAAELAKIWFGNFIGIILVSLVAIHSRVGITVDCSVRLNDSWWSIFLLAVPCGLLMFAATRFWSIRRSSIGVSLCVVVFINCGFEHCIADMFYLLCDPGATILGMVKVLSAATLGNTVGGFAGMKLIYK